MENIKINATLVTELCQTMDGNSKNENNIPTLRIFKKEKIDDGKIAKYPYYTGNSFRGILHRELAFYALGEAIKKEFKIDIANYHLISAGGGSNYAAQTLDTVKKIRDINPIVSVFGASLAIEGKLMLTDFEPIKFFWQDDKNNEDFKYSRVLGRTHFTKVDDPLSEGNKYATLVDDELRKAYMEDVLDTQEQRADERKSKSEKKTKKKTIQSWNMYEYIIKGTRLQGFIGYKRDFNQLERGMLLKGLVLMASSQLGGLRSGGNGVVDYVMEQKDENGVMKPIIVSKSDMVNDVFTSDVETQFSKQQQEDIAAFEDWVKNISLENIDIASLLIESK